MPVVHIYGELSLMKVVGTLVPPGDNVALMGIPQAYHHVMIDQPLALATAIRSLIAAWGA